MRSHQKSFQIFTKKGYSITKLSQIFLSAFALLILSFVTTLLSPLSHKNSTALQSFSELTSLPGFALSVQFFEPRNRFYADENERLFVDMRPINSMDFIYAK